MGANETSTRRKRRSYAPLHAYTHGRVRAVLNLQGGRKCSFVQRPYLPSHPRTLEQSVCRLRTPRLQGSTTWEQTSVSERRCGSSCPTSCPDPARSYTGAYSSGAGKTHNAVCSTPQFWPPANAAVNPPPPRFSAGGVRAPPGASDPSPSLQCISIAMETGTLRPPLACPCAIFGITCAKPWRR